VPTRVFDPVFGKRVFIWDVDFNLLRQYVDSFNAGTWPTASYSSISQESASYCP
jgi:hypothetical protein